MNVSSQAMIFFFAFGQSTNGLEDLNLNCFCSGIRPAPSLGVALQYGIDSVRFVTDANGTRSLTTNPRASRFLALPP